eukprot:881861-Pelagomonas_calceolata.AAC.4
MHHVTSTLQPGGTSSHQWGLQTWSQAESGSTSLLGPFHSPIEGFPVPSLAHFLRLASPSTDILGFLEQLQGVLH